MSLLRRRILGVLYRAEYGDKEIIDREGMLRLAEALREVEEEDSTFKDFTFQAVDESTGEIKERSEVACVSSIQR